jgi:hypothetical protein
MLVSISIFSFPSLSSSPLLNCPSCETSFLESFSHRSAEFRCLSTRQVWGKSSLWNLTCGINFFLMKCREVNIEKWKFSLSKWCCTSFQTPQTNFQLMNTSVFLFELWSPLQIRWAIWAFSKLVIRTTNSILQRKVNLNNFLNLKTASGLLRLYSQFLLKVLKSVHFKVRVLFLKSHSKWANASERFAGIVGSLFTFGGNQSTSTDLCRSESGMPRKKPLSPGIAIDDLTWNRSFTILGEVIIFRSRRLITSSFERWRSNCEGFPLNSRNNV